MEGLDWTLRKREEATAGHRQRRRLERIPGLECENGEPWQARLQVTAEAVRMNGCQAWKQHPTKGRQQEGSQDSAPLPPPPASWATVPARRDVAGVMAEKGFNGPRAWESRGEAMLSELLAAGQLGI